MLGFYLSLLDTAEDKSKFEELYNLYRQDMYKTAYCILKNHYEAEDAVHEAFMIVVKNINKITQVNCPRTRGYLIIIVKNLALKIYNKRKRTESIDDNENDSDADIEDYVISRIDCKKLAELLLKLPEEYYQVLYLNVYMELDIADIAVNLGITYENAKKRLQRARNKLRNLAEGYFEYEH